ncbi:MAG: hypothetical protein KDD94_12775 [Calditrichaeota bacterium]|nr:hypothetical protein [Calditrichota bacterium]
MIKNSIRWLHVTEYNTIYEAEYTSKNRFHEEQASFSLATDDFKSLIPVEPFVAEIDGIGLTLTCFGQVNNHLFYLMNFADSPFPKTILGTDTFEIMADLEELGHPLFQTVNWVNNYPDPASHSVYTIDDNGIKIEVYRALDKEEAKTTAFFFNHRGRTERFFVDAAENLNTSWQVVELTDQGEKEIGRYVDRLSAENFAMDYGKREAKKILVKRLGD